MGRLPPVISPDAASGAERRFLSNRIFGIGIHGDYDEIKLSELAIREDCFIMEEHASARIFSDKIFLYFYGNRILKSRDRLR
jgi:hypothetical protein